MKKTFFTLLLAAVAVAAFSQPPPNMQPTETDALLTVHVTDMKDNPREGESITFISEKTKLQYSGVTKADGKFYVLIPKGQTYKVQYKAFTDEMDYTTFDMPPAKDT